MITELIQSVPVNDTQIAYREMGHGRPLVLLHGGLVSASDVFAATPISYAAHQERLARVAAELQRLGQPGTVPLVPFLL